MKKQHVDNQRGEIDFRRKLFLQQVEGKTQFQDEFDAGGIKDVLADRMVKTYTRMSALKASGILRSPFVEIGAERCQRSLVLENDLGMEGAAVDISFDMLKSCSHYQEVFTKPRAPFRICCDANNLPFLAGSIPFVFCYETLHHFPEPQPVAREIYRVLSPGGCFFFDEEPFRKILHLNLYRTGNIYSDRQLKRSAVKKVLDYFFSEKACNEVEHGILENEDIPLSAWRQALGIFDRKDAGLRSLGFIESSLFGGGSPLMHVLCWLLGGVISGTCRKAGAVPDRHEPLSSSLICPSCREKGNEVLLHSPAGAHSCPRCLKQYPLVDGVLFLFSHDKLRELYPDIPLP